MLRTLCKDANAGHLHGLWIELTEHIQKYDVEDISRSILGLDHSRICACVEFLSDLNVKRNAADGRSDWNTELRNASDLGCDEVYRLFIGRPKVNLYGLETTTAIGDGNVNAYGVNKFEIMRNLDAKRKLVEAERKGPLKR